jgi:hypothetical protein
MFTCFPSVSIFAPLFEFLLESLFLELIIDIMDNAN